MISPEIVDGPVLETIVVVSLAGFYGGLSRELSTTADFLDTRLGLSLSLGPYVAAGVALLLSIAIAALEASGAYQADKEFGAVVGLVFGLFAVFLLTFGVSFKLGIAIYDLLLRIGLSIS